jgi:polygalacturonase
MPSAVLLFVGSVLGAAISGGGVFDVTHYGAKGDNSSDDTAAVRAAFAAAKAAGGGNVRFPAGKCFLIGPVNVSSHTIVDIEAGTTILGNAQADWPIVDPRLVWPQYSNGGDCFPLSDPRCYAQMHQPLFFSWNTVNITVRGAQSPADGSSADGVIDGHGSEWWGCAGSCPHVPYCSGGQKIGTPGSKSCPLCPQNNHPCNGISRPHLIMMANVTDVSFVGVRIQHSPDWTLHFSSCENVHVDGCWVYNAHNPNGDGIDIDSTQNAVIENSHIDTEDVRVPPTVFVSPIAVRVPVSYSRACLLRIGLAVRQEWTGRVGESVRPSVTKRGFQKQLHRPRGRVDDRL